MPPKLNMKFHPYQYLESIEHQIYKLHAICELGYLEHLCKFIHEKPDVISQIINRANDASGDTPLHRVARNGHVEMMQILLNSGANPLALNVEGYNVIAWAVMLDKGAECYEALSMSEGWAISRKCELYYRTVKSFCNIMNPRHSVDSIKCFHEAMKGIFDIQDCNIDMLLGVLTAEDST